MQTARFNSAIGAVAALQHPRVSCLRSLRKHSRQEAVERHLPAQTLKVRTFLARARPQASLEKDLKRILAHHSEDILMFDLPGPPQSQGIEAYKQTWDLFFSWAQDSGVFDIKQMSITAGDDVAFVTALMRCAGREKNGDKTELDFRLTMGLPKVDDQWTVVHEHHSIPAK